MMHSGPVGPPSTSFAHHVLSQIQTGETPAVGEAWPDSIQFPRLLADHLANAL